MNGPNDTTNNPTINMDDYTERTHGGDRAGTPNPAPATPNPTTTNFGAMDNDTLAAIMAEYVRRGLHMPAPSNPQPSSRPKLEKLNTYDGNTKELRGWILQARAKIMDLQHIGYNEPMIVAYLLNRLQGTALQRMTPWMETNPNDSTDAFLTYLERTFGDTHREQSAANKLNNLRQGNKAFRTYVQDFKQLMAEGGALTASMSEEFKIVALRKGMSDRTYDDAARFAIGSKTLDDYVDHIQAVVDDLDARKLGTARPTFYQQRTHHDPMDIDRVKTRRAGISQMADDKEGSTKEDSTEPSIRRTQGGSDRKRVKWVSWEVQQERGKKGLCFRCGGSGHLQAQCPYLPPRRPDNTSNVRYVGPLLEDDEGPEPSNSNDQTEESLN